MRRRPSQTDLRGQRRTESEIDWTLRHVGRRCNKIGTEADVSAHVLDISGKNTQLRGLIDTGAVLSIIPIETWERMGFNKDDLIDSRIRLSAANKEALRVLGRTPIIALNLGNATCG